MQSSNWARRAAQSESIGHEMLRFQACGIFSGRNRPGPGSRGILHDRHCRLMPVGVQINRNATSQTAATNIMAAIVADLRTTPAVGTTSPQFAITFDTEKTLYFDALGQVSASLGPDSRYRLNITWHSAPAGLHYAVLKVTWPASVDPATATPSGLVKIFAAFDRN